MDTYDRIEKLMLEHGEKASDLAKATGMSTGLLSQWKSRMQKPSAAKLSKVAAHYNVTTDYLLTGKQEEKATPADTSSSDASDEGQLMAAFFEGGENLSEDEMAGLWQDAKDYINWKLAQRRKANNGQ